MTERTRGPSAASRALRLLAVAIVAALAYVLFLIVTAPASVVGRILPDVPEDTVFAGSIWHGSARFGNTARVGWDFDAAASRAALAPVFAVEVTGPDTRLTGWASAGPMPRPTGVTLRDVRGRAGWSLAMAAVPDLTIRCTPIATVDLAAVTLRQDRTVHAEGTLRSPAGTCRNLARPDMPPVAVPPLVAIARTDAAGAAQAVLATRDAPDVTLAEARLDDRAVLTLTVRPEGARMVPGLPTAFPIVVEMPLR